MLQGASPFASTVDLANFLDSSVPEYDFVDIQRLRDADKIDDHIYKKIRETGFYSDEELQVIKTVLEKTLRTKIKDRIGTLMPIGEFLVRCATCSPEEAAARSVTFLYERGMVDLRLSHLQPLSAIAMRYNVRSAKS